MNAQTAVAHIITADAVALGDPEILIFEHEEGGAGRLIERLDLIGAKEHDGWDIAASLTGWRYNPARMTLIEHGYWTVDIERFN